MLKVGQAQQGFGEINWEKLEALLSSGPVWMVNALLLIKVVACFTQQGIMDLCELFQDNPLMEMMDTL